MSDRQASFSDSAVGTFSVRILMRNYLSSAHLYASCYAAEAAAAREDNLIDSSPTADIRHQGYVISAVMEAVAFLEATINELYQDAADSYLEHLAGLTDSHIELLGALWQATDNGRAKVLSKYDLALRLGKREGLDRSRNPYQDVRSLVDLRNHLVHYRPEMVGADVDHKLADQLKGRFNLNGLMVQSGNPLFPDKILGAGCADWAWRSARSFAIHFSSSLGLTLPFQRTDFGDPLPD